MSDGNTHPIIVYPAGDADAKERAARAFAEVMSLAIGLGGTITGEHGVGRLKRAALPEQLGPDVMALTHRIKHALDPQGILNPGADSDDHSPRDDPPPDRRPAPLRPRPVQPLPRGDPRPGGAAARPPRPRLPRDHGRDLRPAPPRLGHRQPPHPAAVGHRLGRDGGRVRQHRLPRRRRRRRGQRPLRRAHGRRRGPPRRRGRPRRARVGHARRRRAGRRCPPVAEDHRRRPRRDLHRRPLRHRRARRASRATPCSSSTP